MRYIPWVDESDDHAPFPPVEQALREPDGLLAAGGRLTPARLELAYRSGVFPWFSEDQPILWWSPDPRAVLYPRDLRVTRSLRKRIRNSGLAVSLDRAFGEVVLGCAAPRPDQSGTWITTSMYDAYCRLAEGGLGHSVEVWREDRLVGGLYGVALGAAFFGESMFSRERDASKIALAWLTRQLQSWGYRFIDCQVANSHLLSMGAVQIPRQRFMAELRSALERPGRDAPWRFDAGFDPLAIADEVT